MNNPNTNQPPEVPGATACLVKFRQDLRQLLHEHGVPSNPGWTEENIVSALRQLIKTPVEIKLLPTATRGVCECGDLPYEDARFCEDCGRPIKWNKL